MKEELGVWKPQSIAETEKLGDDGIQFDIPRENLILNLERKFVRKQAILIAWASITSIVLLLFF